MASSSGDQHSAAPSKPVREEGKGNIKKRAVAGSFLFKIPTGDEKQAKVALFRRSGNVRTYQHKLAPISGSVETDDANPLATALREIKEETTLTPTSIDLLRVGKPYSFIDESIGREWSINPFAFRLKDTSEGGKGEGAITLDWEHEAVEWFDPLDVKDGDEFGGVPKLVNSLRRVWPEYDLGPKAGKVLTAGLQRLRDDHESGARQLAGMAISSLKTLVVEMDSTTLDGAWWANLRMAAWHLCKSRESMGAAITSAVLKVLNQVEQILHQTMAPAEKINQIVEAIDSQLALRQSTTDRIRDSFADYLRQNILSTTPSKKTVSVLTLSSSSTISSCLLQAASSLGVALDLRVLESRPLCEGVTLASKLLQGEDDGTALTVTLYSDASAALAANGIDVVVLGADRISSAGDVSNKIGSLPAVLSARHVAPNSNVVIISETEKIAGPGSIDDHQVEENDPAELVQAWKGPVHGAQIIENALRDKPPELGHRKTYVKNTYFEWVPSRFIDAFATEEGIWSAQDIAKRSEWIGNEMERFFKNV